MGLKLDRITFTGADDSITPDRLVDFAVPHPFVEWGILFSKTRIGQPRYPSVTWLHCLEKLAPLGVMFSAHLCGEYARSAVRGLGIEGWVSDFKHAPFLRLFQR